MNADLYAQVAVSLQREIDAWNQTPDHLRTPYMQGRYDLASWLIRRDEWIEEAYGRTR